jgi:hypothetical protein
MEAGQTVETVGFPTKKPGSVRAVHNLVTGFLMVKPELTRV